MSVLNRVRSWIDGDSSERALEQAARDAQVKPRSKAEEFIVKIAREIESIMQAEMVPLPQGTTIIPSEYTVFLSADDDKEWQGVKRKGLEQGLFHILAERAKEIAGKKKLETKSFVIELRVDATLMKGEVTVQHSWEESASNKTGVLARPRSLPDLSPVVNPKPVAAASGSEQMVPKSNITPIQPVAPPTVSKANIPKAVPLDGGESEEMTHVANRMKELYRLEVWRGGIRQNVVPIFQNEIVVGRGSKSKPVDIPLSGDVEISRRHLTISTDGTGNFWVSNEGKNPAAINDHDLPMSQRVMVSPGTNVVVCSYTLRIQLA